MKKAIVILLILVLILFLIALFRFGDLPGAANTAPTEGPTQPTVKPTESTEPPTEEPTEPTPELLFEEESVFLNGTLLTVAIVEENVFVRAADFASAMRLGFSANADSARFYGAIPASFTADERKITLNAEAHTLDFAPFLHDGQLYLPLMELAQALDFSTFYDEEFGKLYITPGAKEFSVPEDVNVPVLMYHAVSDNMWGIAELFVSPADMEAQLAYLVENGYDPIWFEDLAHVEDYDKPVILTFDDGYDDNYTELFPLLQKYNVKATVFIITSAIGTSNKMTEAQIRELSDSGLVSIQSHTVTHEYLDSMGEERLIREMADSKLALTRLTGKEPSVLCYPTGKYSNLSLEIAAEYYNFGLKMVGGLYNTSDDPFLVNRYYISRYTGIGTFASYVSAAGT
ncbi:MAG: polysaccharide deacetylase family protein [Oscillospiraceae bacterium]|jgi:peptidoglycan/xylan/chitin deacetylase (PgdA/CDA1 family)|nr:polysaccharide deacetylase family protein [Oscillospiraceae bacterium]